MGILDGVRILDFTQHQAGPYGTALLADFGADVVKIERPGGDPARTNLPEVDGVNPFFLANNRGKRSLCLDLSRPEGREVAVRLAGRADVLVHNLRPGAMEKLGLSYRDLRPQNPRLVYAAVSTYGPFGSKASVTGVDLVAQAESGLMSVTGPEDGPGMPVGVALADALGGIQVAFAVTAALLARERTGRGQEVHVSLVGGLLGVQVWEFQHYLLSREEPRRAGRSHPLVKTLWQSFEAADGAFVLAEVSDAWPGICRAVGRPELVEDERFRSLGRRLKNRRELLELLQQAFASRTVAECVERLRAEGVLAAPVRGYRELAADPDLRANGYVRTLEHPGKGTLEVLGPFLHFFDTPAELRGPAPALGAHSDEILGEAGYTPGEIARLREIGAIR